MAKCRDCKKEIISIKDQIGDKGDIVCPEDFKKACVASGSTIIHAPN